MIGSMLDGDVVIPTAGLSSTEAFSYVGLAEDRLLIDDISTDTGPTIEFSGPGYSVSTRFTEAGEWPRGVHGI